MRNTMTKQRNYNRKREIIVSNLTIETPIMFKHTIDLEKYPEFNQLSEEKIKVFLTEMVITVFELKEMEKKVNQYNSGTYCEVVA
jgi:hypothetical protein